MSDNTNKSENGGQDYVYKRKDGGTTFCYGEVEENSNFLFCTNMRSCDL